MLAGPASTALSILAKTMLPAIFVGALSGLFSAAVKVLGFGTILEMWLMRLHGETVYLKPFAARIVQGDGLKRDQQFYNTSGLLLGPNSPFKNAPNLGLSRSINKWMILNLSTGRPEVNPYRIDSKQRFVGTNVPCTSTNDLMKLYL